MLATCNASRIIPPIKALPKLLWIVLCVLVRGRKWRKFEVVVSFDGGKLIEIEDSAPKLGSRVSYWMEDVCYRMQRTANRNLSNFDVVDTQISIFIAFGTGI